MANPENSSSDSLKNYTYDEIYHKIRSSKMDAPLQKIYMDEFLKKAKTENDAERIFYGYRNFVNYSKTDDILCQYADSMILFTKKTKNPELIGSALLSRGIAKYGKKLYVGALDDYLEAAEILKETENKHLQYKLKYNIAQVKYFLENFQEAIELYEECIEFFRKDDGRAYLNSLHMISLCYHRIGDIGLSSDLNRLGIDEGERLSNNSMWAYFNYLEGINHYFRNNYNLATKQIHSSLAILKNNNDFSNEAVAHFYLGKSYLQLENKSEAFRHFLIVDEIFTSHKYIRPDLRETYLILIENAKNNNDLKSERFFTCQLIKTDSILIANQRRLPSKLHREFDTKELNDAKNFAEQENFRQVKINRIFLFSILIISSIAILIGYRYHRNKTKYELKFRELMDEKIMEPKIVKTKLKTENLNPEIESSLLKQLEKFERNKTFLEKDLNQAKLAAHFNSNIKYLSIIIQTYRQKGYNEYINDLKADYVVKQLKNDRLIRKYNNAALAELAGFSTIERFTKAFKSKFGIPPTVFIEKLKNELESENN